MKWMVESNFVDRKQYVLFSVFNHLSCSLWLDTWGNTVYIYSS